MVPRRGIGSTIPSAAIDTHSGVLCQTPGPAGAASHPPSSFRLFLGYAGWSAGQLVEEILRNDWLTAPVQEELIFVAEPERAWDAALSSVGVDPAALPSWTGGASDEEAN